MSQFEATRIVDDQGRVVIQDIFALRIVIVAHISRARNVRHIQQQLHPVRAVLFWTYGAPSPVKAFENMARAWDYEEPGVSHLVILQDDVRLTSQFWRVLSSALIDSPSNIICLFTEWLSVTANLQRVAALSGFGTCEIADRYIPLVAAIYPVDMANYLAAVPQLALQDDVHAHRACQEGGLSPLATAQSVVEHVGSTSLLSPSTSRRRLAAIQMSMTLGSGGTLRTDVVPGLVRSAPGPLSQVFADGRWCLQSYAKHFGAVDRVRLTDIVGYAPKRVRLSNLTIGHFVARFGVAQALSTYQCGSAQIPGDSSIENAKLMQKVRRSVANRLAWSLGDDIGWRRIHRRDFSWMAGVLYREISKEDSNNVDSFSTS